jgi:hypothetical protein
MVGHGFLPKENEIQVIGGGYQVFGFGEISHQFSSISI